MRQLLINTARIAAAILWFCCLMVGTLLVFASFFFEETRLQMTWAAAGRNLLIFVLGVAIIAAPITVLQRFVLDRW